MKNLHTQKIVSLKEERLLSLAMEESPVQQPDPQVDTLAQGKAEITEEFDNLKVRKDDQRNSVFAQKYDRVYDQMDSRLGGYKTETQKLTDLIVLPTDAKNDSQDETYSRYHSDMQTYIDGTKQIYKAAEVGSYAKLSEIEARYNEIEKCISHLESVLASRGTAVNKPYLQRVIEGRTEQTLAKGKAVSVDIHNSVDNFRSIDMQPAYYLVRIPSNFVLNIGPGMPEGSFDANYGQSNGIKYVRFSEGAAKFLDGKTVGVDIFDGVGAREGTQKITTRKTTAKVSRDAQEFGNIIFTFAQPEKPVPVVKPDVGEAKQEPQETEKDMKELMRKAVEDIMELIQKNDPTYVQSIAVLNSLMAKLTLPRPTEGWNKIITGTNSTATLRYENGRFFVERQINKPKSEKIDTPSESGTENPQEAMKRGISAVKQHLEMGHGPDGSEVTGALEDLNAALHKINQETDRSDAVDALGLRSGVKVHDGNNGLDYAIIFDVTKDQIIVEDVAKVASKPQENVDLELQQTKNRFTMIKGRLNELKAKFDKSGTQVDLNEFRDGVREAIGNRRVQIQDRAQEAGVDAANDPLMTELRAQMKDLQDNYLQPYADKEGVRNSQEQELLFAKNRFTMIKGMLDGLRTKFDASNTQADLAAYRDAVQEAVSNRRGQILDRAQEAGVDKANDPLMTELRAQMKDLQDNYLQPYADKEGVRNSQEQELLFAKNRFNIVKGMLDGLRTKFDASNTQADLAAYRDAVQEAVSNRRGQILERAQEAGVDKANDPLMTELRAQMKDLQDNYLQPYAEKKGTEEVIQPKPETPPNDLLMPTEKDDIGPTKFTSLKTGPRPNEAVRESAESVEKSYDQVKQEQLVKRELAKYSEALGKDGWTTLDHGKTDGKNQFMYHEDEMTIEGQKQNVLIAFSPAGGLQVMNTETGQWRFVSTLAPEDQKQFEKFGDFKDLHADTIAAEAKAGEKDGSFQKRAEQNQKNHDIEEKCLKDANADKEWFKKNKGSDMFTGLNDPIRKALEDALRIPDDAKNKGPSDGTSTDAPSKAALVSSSSSNKPSDASSDKPTDKPSENTEIAELKKQLAEQAKMLAEQAKMIEELKKLIEELRNPKAAEASPDAKTPEATDKEKTGPEKLTVLEKELAELNTQKDTKINDYQTFIGKGLSYGVENVEEAKKIDTDIKDLDKKIEEKQREIDALKASEKPTEDLDATLEKIDPLITERNALNAEYGKLDMKKSDDRERATKILDRTKVIDADLGKIREELKKLYGTINRKADTDAQAKVEKITSAQKKIDAVLGPVTAETQKIEDKKPEISPDVIAQLIKEDPNVVKVVELSSPATAKEVDKTRPTSNINDPTDKAIYEEATANWSEPASGKPGFKYLKTDVKEGDQTVTRLVAYKPWNWISGNYQMLNDEGKWTRASRNLIAQIK